MPTPQSGILTEANSHATFVVFSFSDDEAVLDSVRKGCAAVPALTEAIAALEPDARLTSVVAIGAQAWDRLYREARPCQLRLFRARADHGRIAPATPGDLLIHIRSERRDLNYLLLKKIMRAFDDSLALVEETNGFRYLDSRDLTGFVDGTENPEGEERAAVALVDQSEPNFAGGSYVSLQRYVHDLQAWESLNDSQQEAVIGRTKHDNIELDDAHKPETAHISRVVIEQNGEELEILRHSMPYANSQQAGLLFIAYAKTPDNFDRMLDRMITADANGCYDHLMDYTRAVSGVAFFAPSLDFLRAQ